jgi:signal transduction histidine kinase
MSSFGLERLFAPRSLALVGGSVRPSSLGAKVLQNLVSGGFAGEIAVVNPKYPAIDGKNTYPDLASLPFVPDLIVITAPAPSIPGIMAKAGRLGVAGIVADKVQIQQVAHNLIRNAVEAMETTSRRDLTIAVTRRDESALFSIADTGTGISPEIAKCLFLPFVTSKANGMGVGLSICS